MSSSVTSMLSTDSAKTLSESALDVLRTRGENMSVREGFRTLSATSYSPLSSIAENDSFQIPDE
ncbi:MAG: hypothetical protein MMC33_004397, partial [Icmadophila ericetorum]|nr:hypothetical protein [Icmadophila ericetorum]